MFEGLFDDEDLDAVLSAWADASAAYYSAPSWERACECQMIAEQLVAITDEFLGLLDEAKDMLDEHYQPPKVMPDNGR